MATPSRIHLVLAAALCLGSAPVAGSTATPDGGPQPWWRSRRATGEWGGARPWLDERGLTLELAYTGEVFSNLRGGIDTDDATEYRGIVDLTVTLDTEKLGLWPGGTFFVDLQNAHGRGISEEHVGDLQALSNIDGDTFTQLSEYWHEQRLLRGRLRVKLGRQDANADFCALEGAGDFIHSSFGQIPTVPLPTFPQPKLGAALFLEPAAWVSLAAGGYDGDREGGVFGLDATLDGRDGWFSLAELTLRPAAAVSALPPGAYRVGVWYDSDDVEEISDAAEPRTLSHNHGIYLAFDQLLHQERAKGGDPQGLAAFAQFGWAPGDRNEFTRYLGGGLVYRGLVPGRDRDALGVGVAHVAFSGRVRRLEGREHETALEVFYKAELTPFLALQPDLQFIVTPGGSERNALAAGLRFAVDL